MPGMMRRMEFPKYRSKNHVLKKCVDQKGLELILCVDAWPHLREGDVLVVQVQGQDFLEGNVWVLSK